MISQILEPKTTSSSPLNLTSDKEETPTLSFSQLLKGLDSKVESKTIQKGVLVLSLEDANQESQDIKIVSKTDTLLSLLKNETTHKTDIKELVELNPAITSSMNTTELKTLVLNAKEYLKDKILQSPEYKKAEVTQFPKTLKGLAQLADKFGIQVSKISLQEVQEKATSQVELKTTSKVELHIHKESLKRDVNVELKSEIPKLKEALSIEPKVASKNELPSTKELLKKDVNVELKSESPKAALKNELSSTKEPLKKDVNVEFKSEIPKVTSKNELPSTKEPLKKDLNVELKSETPKVAPKETTPLFKAQLGVSEVIVQKIVSPKIFNVDEKSSKVKVNNSLKSLLRTENSSQTNSSFTADAVVDTARVIAPSATTQLSKGLESLLFSEGSEGTTSSKLDGLTMNKADSFEVKLNEAKQMIRYLSSDVKTAIEDYKSPFTRVKLQLNPQKLGEVDLTIVQRGKNLHINLSSNSVAINTLSMNVNELRAQLNNSGINNASLNFNNSSQSDSQNSSQQQNRQNERQARDEYNYFESEETNEEILSSLEIIVPDYA